MVVALTQIHLFYNRLIFPNEGVPFARPVTTHLVQNHPLSCHCPSPPLDPRSCGPPLEPAVLAEAAKTPRREPTLSDLLVRAAPEQTSRRPIDSAATPPAIRTGIRVRQGDDAAATRRGRGRRPEGARADDEDCGKGLPLRPPRRIRDPLRPLLPHRLHPLQGSDVTARVQSDLCQEA